MSLTDEDQVAPNAVADEQAVVVQDGGPDAAPPIKKIGAPNSKPIDEDDTYTYRDFATVPAPATGGATVHPQSLQAQKLPAKLATMLSDQELMSVIVWLPHGRSWRVLNRDLFAEHALPRYFGHKNYASFVRIVNAWGFRRVTRGPDRDSYYHELFLRGRPDLHQRMKRLSTAHRKTPVGKDDKSPDFYELSKTSPLPEILFQRHGLPGGGSAMPDAQPSAADPLSQLLAGGAMMGNFNGQMQMPSMLSLMANASHNSAPLNMNPINAAAVNANAQPALPRLAQLQRDNEDLRRRIVDLQSDNRSAQAGASQPVMNKSQQSPVAIPNQLMAGVGSGGTTATDVLQRMMSSNAPTGNNGQSLLSSLGAANVNINAAKNEFSFMPSFPHQDMLLRAMRLENQIGVLPPSQQGAGASSLERAVPSSMMPSAGVGTNLVTDDDKKKAMSEWLSKQQQQGLS